MACGQDVFGGKNKYIFSYLASPDHKLIITATKVQRVDVKFFRGDAPLRR